MIFGPKTTHYLRISRGTVLPLHLYLDDRHVEWMTERTLQYVLSDLRPLIREKLEVERPYLLGVVPAQAAKQFTSKVETYRGESYQFGWWFTKAEPHAVVLKTRSFVRAPTPDASEDPTVSAAEEQPRPASSKRKRPNTGAGSRRRKKNAASGKSDTEQDPVVEPVDVDADEAPIDVDEVPDDASNPIRATSTRPVKVEEESQEQAQLPEPAQSTTRTVTVDFEMGDEEDEKKKPVLQLAFKSFNPKIALCVVVEPYPPLPAQRRQPSIFSAAGIRAMTRAPSETPTLLAPPRAPSNDPREPTPLFLPDYDRQSATPAPFFRQPSLPAVPSFDDEDAVMEDEEPAQDLMEFSQSVRAMAAARGGTPEEDQANDDVLYGDADEMRTGR